MTQIIVQASNVIIVMQLNFSSSDHLLEIVFPCFSCVSLFFFFLLKAVFLFIVTLLIDKNQAWGILAAITGLLYSSIHILDWLFTGFTPDLIEYIESREAVTLPKAKYLLTQEATSLDLSNTIRGRMRLFIFSMHFKYKLNRRKI